MCRETSHQKPPDRVLVLLGASNLSLAWPRIMDTVTSGFSGTTHVYTAHGMGRSYLFAQSAFGLRKLPGIFRSSLWDALPDNVPNGKSFALITDLGNDLLYGSTAAEVAQSAEESICRLRAWSPECRILMTGPPVEAVNKLGWLRFLLARAVLFPLTRLTVSTAKQSTTELARLLNEVAARHKVTLIAPNPDWYGVDPIHIRRRHQRSAFAKILAEWLHAQPRPKETPAALKQRPLAETRWVCGVEKRTPQPVVNTDYVTVFAY